MNRCIQREIDIQIDSDTHRVGWVVTKKFRSSRCYAMFTSNVDAFTAAFILVYKKKNYFSDFPKHTFLPYTILLPHLCPIGCEYYMWIQLYALIHFECCISHKITWWTFFVSLSSDCAEDKMMEMLKPFATQVENKDFSSLLFILLLGCS